MEQILTRIKDRPAGERPYEKCLKNGAKALTDGELLAVILRNGSRQCSSVELAWKLLDLHPSYKGLEGLYHLSLEDFCSVSGIGKVKAIQIICLLELSRRLSRSGFPERFEFTDPADIAAYYMEDMRHLDHETIQLLFLNGRHCLLKEMMLTKGDARNAFVPIRNIYAEALRCEAVYLVMLHNHPSGCPNPSREDLLITARIKEAGQLLGIPLTDHIIIGDRCYYSMCEENVL